MILTQSDLHVQKRQPIDEGNLFVHVNVVIFKSRLSRFMQSDFTCNLLQWCVT